jgi:DNA-binding FadR family transcriptional regulator
MGQRERDGMSDTAFDRRSKSKGSVVELASAAFVEPGVMARKLHTRVADQIGRSVVRGEIPPGHALPSELRICDMMNVSRTAVREALRVLVGKGLLQSRPKSGTKVRDPEHWNHLDPDVLRWQLEVSDVDNFLLKLFQLRHAVEPTASALAAVAATADDHRRVKSAFERMVAAKTNEAFAEADIDFHRNIFRATHNEFFWPIAQMFEHALRECFRMSSQGHHRHRAIDEHRDLMQAIVAGEPERANAAALLLLNNAIKDLVVIRGRDFMGRKAETKKRTPV